MKAVFSGHWEQRILLLGFALVVPASFFIHELDFLFG